MHRRTFLVAPIVLAAASASCAASPHQSSSDIQIVAAQPDLPTATQPAAGAPATATGAPTQQPMTPTLAPTKAPLPAGPIAPFIQSDTWINTKPLAWDSLRGKVVMVEFWTFGCINCQHVIPSLKSMYADYKDKGFTIVSVHSPEFDYEHELANVQQAVKEEGIEYPVALDNDFANWNRYRNRYWPARYLVDKSGVIRHTHIGEGGDAETRQWIEKLLSE